MARYAALTDPGKKRVHNEDAFVAVPDSGLYVVADGVGGRLAGEIASTLCVESFQAQAPALRAQLDAYLAAPTSTGRNAVLSALDDACQQASRRVYETAEAQNKSGMTTTVVAVLVAEHVAFIAHVGDSRVYLLREGHMRQLTDDHTMVNELMRAGKMTASEAKISRHRHVITRAIGLYPSVQPSLAAIDLLPGDRLLMCSDGLSEVVGPEGLGRMSAGPELDAAAKALLDAALSGGGPDNITIILLDPQGGQNDEAILRARILENLFLFEDMPYSARLQVARILNEHWFAPGDTLVGEGQHGDAMFVIIDGEASVKVGGLEVARLGPGEHFGEVSLVDHKPRSASVHGLTFGSAVSISAEQLQTFCRQDPELGSALLWKLLKVMGQRLRQTNARLAVQAPL